MAKAARTLRLIAVIFFCLLFLLPLIWLIQASFKDSAQIFLFPPNVIPDPFVWRNYEVLFRESTGINMPRLLLNSLFYCGVAIAGGVFTNMLIAYGFARFRFPGREALFLIVLGTMMFPAALLWIPRYWVALKVGIVGTWLPIMLPPIIGGSPLYIFFLRQFIRGISTDYDDAAELDGCNKFRVLWNIIAPMLKPGIMFIVINEFVHRWNDIYEPLIFLRRQSSHPLALGLFSFQAKMMNVLVMQTQGEDPLGTFMAMCVLVIIPPLLLYIFFQKFFAEGVKLSGLKG